MVYRVNLVDHKDNRGFGLLQLLYDMSVAATDIIRRLHQPENHIHILHRVFCHTDHIFAKFIGCLMDARRI